MSTIKGADDGPDALDGEQGRAGLALVALASIRVSRSSICSARSRCLCASDRSACIVSPNGRIPEVPFRVQVLEPSQAISQHGRTSHRYGTLTQPPTSVDQAKPMLPERY